MKLLLSVCLLLVFCSSIVAQGPGWIAPPNAQWEYGSSDDLAGVRRVFIDTGSNMVIRRHAIDRIREEIPDLVITMTPDTAEVIMVFAVDVSNSTSTVSTTTSTIDPSGTTAQSETRRRRVTDTFVDRTGFVVKPMGQDRLRLIMDYDRDERSRSSAAVRAIPFVGAYRSSPPPDQRFGKEFARQFVREWKRANPKYKKPRRS